MDRHAYTYGRILLELLRERINFHELTAHVLYQAVLKDELHLLSLETIIIVNQEMDLHRNLILQATSTTAILSGMGRRVSVSAVLESLHRGLVLH